MYVCVYSFIYLLIDETNRYKKCSSPIFNIVLLKRKRVYALTGIRLCLVLVQFFPVTGGKLVRFVHAVFTI
jgi:hypothetical protein